MRDSQSKHERGGEPERAAREAELAKWLAFDPEPEAIACDDAARAQLSRLGVELSSAPTAREVATSNFSRSAPRAAVSARVCMTAMFASPRRAATASRNRAFLPVASSSVKPMSGRAIASGIAGSPPPEPMSITLSTVSIEASGPSSVRLSTTCRVQALSLSMRVRLKRSFVANNMPR